MRGTERCREIERVNIKSSSINHATLAPTVHVTQSMHACHAILHHRPLSNSKSTAAAAAATKAAIASAAALNLGMARICNEEGKAYIQA